MIAIGLLQLAGAYSFFADHTDWNGFTSLILALIVAEVPIIGGILGMCGAHYGWGWSWAAAFILYFGLTVLILLVMTVGSTATKRK